jgi:hypothetical protein
MRPPRRWTVWLVVVVVVGLLQAPNHADARPSAPLLFPSDLSDTSNGDPDVPVNPRPSPEFRFPRLVAVILETGRLECVCVVLCNPGPWWSRKSVEEHVPRGSR